MEITTTLPIATRKWYEIWRDIWLHPGTATFQKILQEPDSNSTRGYKWVAVTALINVLLSIPTYVISLQKTAPDVTSYYVIFLLCVAVLSPIFAIIGIMITAGIYHWIAKLFGGNGDWGQLVFCLATISAPLLLLNGLFGLLSSLFGSALLSQSTALEIVLYLPSLALGIYTIVLNVCAIKAVEKIDTGRAIATVFSPTIIGIVIGLCMVIGFFPALSR
jgi:hypothetical protein